MYKVYKSSVILQNLDNLINDLNWCKNLNMFKDYTRSHNQYNLFSLNPNSLVLNMLFIELKKKIRKFLQTDEPLWIECWLNYHYPNEVLTRHNHYWPWHGYISIRPFDTTTVFDNYEIKNKVGNIYIGEGHNAHYVKVNKPFYEPRITIGFDIKDTNRKIDMKNDTHFSFIPLS